MKLLLINPNTSEAFTAAALKAARACAAPGTQVDAVCSPCGPQTLEGYFDEVISAIGVLKVVQREKEDYDGFISACFSNHFSIAAARQLTNKPIVGIFEPPMLLAKQLGNQFSIVTSSPRWKPILEKDLRAVGLESSCASVRPIGLDVKALEQLSTEALEEHLCLQAERALHEDGAEVIVLGCCGLAGLSDRLQARLGVPVLDPVASAVTILEDLVSYGFRTSRIMSFSPVMPQAYKNVPEIFCSLYEGRDISQC